MENGDLSSATWTYETAEQQPGSDWVTIYLHETDNFSVQTKVTLNDQAAAVTWAAERGFPDPSTELSRVPGPNGVLRT